MLPTFVIGLREGVEAALIVGIVAGFLRQEGRRDALRPMWTGVLLAIAICVAVGVGLELLDEALPQRQQEGLETIVGAAAIGIVTFMIVWMKRNARGLSSELRGRAGAALAAGSVSALVAMAFFAVIREGLETVVFLIAVLQGADNPATAALGAFLGLLVAAAIGTLIYRGGIKLNLQRFFKVTGLVLVLVAAGLVANSLHTAHEAGWLNAGQNQALDLTWLVVPGTWTSALLTGMLGWQPQPTEAELIGYLAFLIPASLYVLAPGFLRRPQVASVTCVLLLCCVVLAGCGGSGDGAPPAASSGKPASTGGPGTVEIKLTDAGCDPATIKLDAGRTTFKITNAGTGRVSEAEVLSGARILGEKENLVAGLSGSFTLDLQPGEYSLSCPGGTTNATGVVTVGGTAASSAGDPLLAGAVSGYQRYVATQAKELVKRVEAFVAAVKAGDVEHAKEQFAAARAPYETIEPVAESFGTLDPDIDARVNDVEKGQSWTGFHRIEQALWEKGSTEGLGPIADKLLADVKTLQAKTETLSYKPDELANGANGLLDEVASSKISGEEDRYSHTDLSDFEANVNGSQTTFGLLAPALRANDAALADSIKARFDAVQKELATLKQGDAYPSYDTVDDAERQRLADLVAAPGEAARAALGRARRMIRATALAVVVALLAPASARAATLPDDLASTYTQAVRAHDATLAAHLRTEVQVLKLAQPSPAVDKLAETLEDTRNQLRPWPLASDVADQAANIKGPGPFRFAGVREALGGALASDRAAAAEAALEAYTRSARERQAAPELDAAMWVLLGALEQNRPVKPAVNQARTEFGIAQQRLGEVKISRGTVVTDAAIVVFREGLEAVLILAAITASLTGARAWMRRPVLLGGVAGIGATIVTWALVQLLISELGTGGLRLEAITGIVAIVVLLVVTNWFFHKVYWSQWISRFNRRRKVLTGFFGLMALGLTSVYREGFETVLFVQNLQVSAGTAACLLGSAIGLAGTLAVGGLTFAAQRKLPYKKMLIATGVMIAFVLAVMTGSTVHVMQGLGWVPASAAPFDVPVWCNSWLGLYPTWEGIGAQLGALLIVLGSYFVAREMQVGALRRRRTVTA